jgi:YD repeat-containing protein
MNFKDHFVLLEKIYGNIGWVYHRTGKYGQDITTSDIFSTGIKPSKNLAAMYGSGLYTTYDLEDQLKPKMAENYGPVILKGKIDLNNFVILDKDVYEKTNSKVPFERYIKSLKYIDYNELINTQFTSDIAVDFWKKFKQEDKSGIIFTGRTDGRVAVIWDRKHFLPVGYSIDDGKTWTQKKPDIKTIKDPKKRTEDIDPERFKYKFKPLDLKNKVVKNEDGSISEYIPNTNTLVHTFDNKLESFYNPKTGKLTKTIEVNVRAPVTTSFDEKERAIKREWKSGGTDFVEEYTYHDNGQIKTHKNVFGSEKEFNENGKLIKEIYKSTFDDNYTTTYFDPETENKTKTVYSTGTTIYYKYYDNGLLKSETSSDGSYKEYNDDGVNNSLAKEKNKEGIETVYSYHNNGKLKSKVSSDGTYNKYDKNGVQTKSKNENGKELTYSYYENGNLKSIISDDGTYKVLYDEDRKPLYSLQNNKINKYYYNSNKKKKKIVKKDLDTGEKELQLFDENGEFTLIITKNKKEYSKTKWKDRYPIYTIKYEIKGKEKIKRYMFINKPNKFDALYANYYDDNGKFLYSHDYSSSERYKNLKTEFKPIEESYLRENVNLDLNTAYNLFKTEYEKNGTPWWSQDKFNSRARSWEFYGDENGVVAIRRQRSGYAKLVGTAGNDRSKYKGFKEILSMNIPLWGMVTKPITEMAKKMGLRTPNFIERTVLKQTLMKHPEVMGDMKVLGYTNDGGVQVEYPDVGRSVKYFVANDAYYKKSKQSFKDYMKGKL